MSLEKAYEEFEQAVHGIRDLFVEKSLKEHLIDAFQYHLIYVDPNDIPDKKSRDDFEKIIGDLKAKGGGSVAINKMTKDEAKELADKLTDIYSTMIKKG